MSSDRRTEKNLRNLAYNIRKRRPDLFTKKGKLPLRTRPKKEKGFSIVVLEGKRRKKREILFLDEKRRKKGKKS